MKFLILLIGLVLVSGIFMYGYSNKEKVEHSSFDYLGAVYIPDNQTVRINGELIEGEGYFILKNGSKYEDATIEWVDLG